MCLKVREKISLKINSYIFQLFAIIFSLAVKTWHGRCNGCFVTSELLAVTLKRLLVAAAFEIARSELAERAQ